MGCGSGPSGKLCNVSFVACRRTIGRKQQGIVDSGGFCSRLSGFGGRIGAALSSLRTICATTGGWPHSYGSAAIDSVAAADRGDVGPGSRVSTFDGQIQGNFPLKCRHCKEESREKFLDLGVMPPSNAYLSKEDLEKPEHKYPLRLLVCTNCWLVQTEDFVGRSELFTSEYAYFSSTSSSWLKHAADYCEKIIPLLGLGPRSLVVEIASNDGYLLKNFLSAGIPCLGIEPTASTAAAAAALGIPVIQEFFGEKFGQTLAAEGKQADLIIGNNVFAHVPDINDFAKGLKALLKPTGTITLEFPHLMKMIEFNQFDTAYHEHFSYLSFRTAKTILEKVGLSIWDVEELATHGGSLRIYAGHSNEAHQETAAVVAVLAEERRRGMQKSDIYKTFQAKADCIRDEFRAFLEEQKASGKKVAAYGAAAKGNTLLNFAGVKTDLLPAVYDAASSKQHKFMPGSKIPIRPPAEMAKDNPDFIVILPWNIAEEIRQQNLDIEKRGARFVTAIPEIRIL